MRLSTDPKYRRWYELVVEWSFGHFADSEYGEWYGYLHRDGSVASELKGSMWKGPFHLPRMLYYGDCARRSFLSCRSLWMAGSFYRIDLYSTWDRTEPRFTDMEKARRSSAVHWDWLVDLAEFRMAYCCLVVVPTSQFNHHGKVERSSGIPRYLGWSPRKTHGLKRVSFLLPLPIPYSVPLKIGSLSPAGATKVDNTISHWAIQWRNNSLQFEALPICPGRLPMRPGQFSMGNSMSSEDNKSRYRSKHCNRFMS